MKLLSLKFAKQIGLLSTALLAQAATAATATAIFAGGCFWCTESDFEKLPGVIAAESGYTAGKTPNPTYKLISTGTTGHTEAVRVTYDPAKVTYSQLVEYFWKTIDPTEKDKQFCDEGSQYRSGIYCLALGFVAPINAAAVFTGATKPSAKPPPPAAMRCSKPAASKPSTPNSPPPAPFIWPRNTTKTITRKTPCATATTATAVAAMRS
jgi:hypothetical protein